MGGPLTSSARLVEAAPDPLRARRDHLGVLEPEESEAQLELDGERLVDSTGLEPVEAEIDLPDREPDQRSKDELARGMEQTGSLRHDARPQPGPRSDVELGPGIEEPAVATLDLPEPLVLR